MTSVPSAAEVIHLGMDTSVNEIVAGQQRSREPGHNGINRGGSAT
ncbi:MAG: hypothetical protein ACLPN6_07265 [Streptosporangiaceae bacterium]|jgi:hypothetical protein